MGCGGTEVKVALALLLDRLEGTEEAFIACKETHVKLCHPKAFKSYLILFKRPYFILLFQIAPILHPITFELPMSKVLKTCELSAINRAYLNFPTTTFPHIVSGETIIF